MGLGFISLMKRLLRPLFTRLARSLGVLDIHARLDELSRRVAIYDSGNKSMDQLAGRRASEAIEDRLEKFRTEVASYENAVQEAVMNASRIHTETVVNEMRTYFENEVSKLKRGMDRVRSTSEATGPIQRPELAASQIPTQASPVEEALYVALEDHFRGDPSIIRERQAQYIPYIKDVVTTGKPLLDLGCGRGEWLTVLREQGISARGIDSNRACIDDCRQLGLDVDLADLVDYLNAVPEGSLGAITMFQVMEHLPFPVLLNVLRAILRALTPGGVFIGEVPNSETLSVAASTFWIDPTHERPLFPGLLLFLAGEVGFRKSEGVYSSPLKPEPNVSSLPSELQEDFLAMFRQLNGPGDFALIATA